MQRRLHFRARLGSAITIALIAAIALAACSSGSNDAGETESPSAGVSPAENVASGTAELRFVNDPDLSALASAEALMIPPRFTLRPRADREPILTLGLVDAAARLTYSSGATNEILSIDILELDPDVDSEGFFRAFASSLADQRDLRGARDVGIVRGIGEDARHITFTIEGDDGDAAAILRDGLVALATYRRPSGLREVVDMGEFLQALDASLQTAR